jgi:hypothetical protein
VVLGASVVVIVVVLVVLVGQVSLVGRSVGWVVGIRSSGTLLEGTKRVAVNAHGRSSSSHGFFCWGLMLLKKRLD